MNSNSRLTKLVALSLTILALAIPAVAAASPIGPTLGEYHAAPADSSTPAASVVAIESGIDGGAYDSSSPADAPTPTGTVVAAEPGFDWGDAAIGASIAMAVVVIGAGGVLVARTLREDRTRFRVTG
jgi:hypothetical protein